MKKVCVVLCACLISFCFTTKNETHASNEKVLQAGTYILDVTANDQSVQLHEQLRLTIKGTYSTLDKEAREGIDAVDFEYSEKDLNQCSVETLVRKAEAHAWSLDNGNYIPIKRVEINHLDSIESLVTFYTARNTSTTIHAYASGSEIFGSKEYKNIEGRSDERDWEIQYRSIFTVVFTLLLIAPVCMSLAITILMESERAEMEKIAFGTSKAKTKKRKRKHKWFILCFILPLLFPVTSIYAKTESSAYTYEARDIVIDIQTYLDLVESEKLENYIRDIANIEFKNREGQEIELPYEFQTENSSLLFKITNASEQKKFDKAKANVTQKTEKTYVSRSLRLGDHATFIPAALLILALLMAIPFYHLLMRRHLKRIKR